MFFILACLFLARRYGTSAAPFAPPLADPLANFVPSFARDKCSNICSCPGRSLWDIVWSCLATTFAVTWVSMHPNVPFLEEKSWPLLRRRIFLMCLALLAPEVMIMWAFKQWRGAVMIRETINKARPKSCVQWTMTHAHFLQMGGFKLNYIKGSDFDCSSDYCYKTKKKGIMVRESVLNFDDLQKLLEKQLIDFPDTTAKEIEDRSKGDALSKGVALLQITWFIVQLVARAHQHLAISEMELTTAALAGLNSILYLFWWSKPLDVRCPIVIRTKELERKFVKKGRRNHRHGAHAHSRSVKTWTFTEDEFRLGDYLRDSPAWVAFDLAAKTVCPVWMRTIFCRFACFAQSTMSAIVRLLRHQTKKDVDPEIGLQTLSNSSEDASETKTKTNLALHRSDGPSPATRSHFRRAVEWISTTCTLVTTKLFHLPYMLMFFPIHIILSPNCYFNPENYADAKVKMDNKPALQLLLDELDMGWIMSMMFYSEKAETTPLVIFSALSGAAFGSIHCAAWHFDFPSPVERILWQTISLSIVALCLGIVAGIPIRNFVEDKWDKSPVHSKYKSFWQNVRSGLIRFPAIVYPLSRVSLLILALISLRNLPDSAFETVTWSMFIPHI